MANSLIDFIVSTINFEQYYKKEFPGWNGDHNSNVSCPFSSKHSTGEDKKPSFSVNINKKGGCNCHACGTKIGSIIHFEKIKYNLGDDETAASSIYNKFIRLVLASPKEVNSYLQPYETALKGNPLIRKKICEEIQITPQTAERFDLGWHSKLRRVTIPIQDSFGQLLNTRYYRLPSMREDDTYPKFLNTTVEPTEEELKENSKAEPKCYGSPAELFPKQQLLGVCRGKHKPPIIYWFTGERDTLLAWDRGIPSFCYTTGENVAKKEWAKELSELGVAIGIVADNDKAGKEGANKRITLLQKENIPCFLVEFENPKVKDFSDYIRESGTVKEFLKLGHDKKSPEKKEDDEEESEEENYTIPRIVDPSKNPHAGEYTVAQIGRTPSLLNRPISVKAIISGKLDKTFSIPSVVQVGDHQYKIPISREMLQFIREKDEKIIAHIHNWLSTKARVKIIETTTVTEVEIIPMIQPGIDTLYVNQRCYFFGSYVECNKPYLMEIIPTTVMDSQETVGLITSMKPVSNILDSYEFKEDSLKLLQENFSIGDNDSFDSLRELAHLLSTKFTHIYNRDDVHICGLLTWLCPLQFEFPCEGLQRGWLNSLLLGDTETGKSRICQSLTQLFQSGVFINAESCSYVGLVGGAVKSSSGMFILRWGKIPLYNRQLVVVEELSGLTIQEISYMSEIRSGGIARYDKAGLTGETSAKTRLIFLSNVRGEGKSLGDYNTGVQAAQGLIGHNEDLARFDLILTVTDDEVDSKIINHDRTTEEKDIFSSVELQAFKELAMFAWSLKPDQIDFTISAYRACLQQTLKLSGEYHSSLPIFKAGSGRLKLARIALAIACIQFSWDFEEKKLKVLDKHVDCAAKILHHFYGKPSFGYARYSKIQYNLQKVLHEQETIQKINETFKTNTLDFYMYLSHSLSFTKFEIAEAMGQHHMFVERVISQLFLSNLLKKGEKQSEWQLSRAGRKWIEKKISEMSDL